MKILADKGHVADKPVEQLVRVGPDPDAVGNVLFKMMKGIVSSQPVSPGFVYEYGMAVVSQLLNQSEAQQAVFASA